MAAAEDRVCAAIALGANLPSAHGPALETLQAVRPLLQALFSGRPGPPRLHWSPLFRTAPVGGPADQPDYLNAVVLVRNLPPATVAEAEALMADLLALESRFGRRRQERWGPRCLDLDLLWWGDLSNDSPSLQLPHPRLRERTFVLAPLVAIDPALVPQAGASGGGGAPTVAALLAALVPLQPEPAPRRLPPAPAWPE